NPALGLEMIVSVLARAYFGIHVAAGLFAVTTWVQAGDWPQWRGPGRDGVWPEHRPPDRLTLEGLKRRWRCPLGGGYGGVAVAAGRVYVMDRQKRPAEVERILCLDAA